MTKEQREALKTALTAAIQEAMRRDPDLLLEAITEGRTGLDEMSDPALISLALDCYGLAETGEKIS